MDRPSDGDEEEEEEDEMKVVLKRFVKDLVHQSRVYYSTSA